MVGHFKQAARLIQLPPRHKGTKLHQGSDASVPCIGDPLCLSVFVASFLPSAAPLELEEDFKRHLVLNLPIPDRAALLAQFEPSHISYRFACSLDRRFDGFAEAFV